MQFISGMQFELAVPPRPAPANDRGVRRLAALSGSAPLGRLAGGADRMPAPLRPPLSTAVRMVDWIHGGAAHVRPPTHPPLPARLPQHDVHVIGISQGADRGPAGSRNTAN